MWYGNMKNLSLQMEPTVWYLQQSSWMYKIQFRKLQQVLPVLLRQMALLSSANTTTNSLIEKSEERTLIYIFSLYEIESHLILFSPKDKKGVCVFLSHVETPVLSRQILVSQETRENRRNITTQEKKIYLFKIILLHLVLLLTI